MQQVFQKIWGSIGQSPSGGNTPVSSRWIRAYLDTLEVVDGGFDEGFDVYDASSVGNHFKRINTSALAAIQATKRGDFQLIDGVQRDLVDCTIFSPPEAVVGDSLLVQVFAHMPEQSKLADDAAREFDADSKRRGTTSLGTEIARGSELTFQLSMSSLIEHGLAKSLVWRGRPESVQFEIEIPENERPRAIIATVLVSIDTVPIGEIKFKIKVLAAGVDVESQKVPTGEARRYRKAFISYAALDRPEVLRRVQMLTAVGIKFFQDVLDLDPGDRWSRKLYLHIDESDVMFLFWSTHAKKSEWVEREWRYCLDRKGDDFIRPVIIAPLQLFRRLLSWNICTSAIASYISSMQIKKMSLACSISFKSLGWIFSVGIGRPMTVLLLSIHRDRIVR